MDCLEASGNARNAEPKFLSGKKKGISLFVTLSPSPNSPFSLHLKALKQSDERDRLVH